MPAKADAFYLLDHRLIALVMVALLLAACEIGYRLGLPDKPPQIPCVR